MQYTRMGLELAVPVYSIDLLCLVDLLPGWPSFISAFRASHGTEIWFSHTCNILNALLPDPCPLKLILDDNLMWNWLPLEGIAWIDVCSFRLCTLGLTSFFG